MPNKKSKLIATFDLSTDPGPWIVTDLDDYSEIYIVSFDQDSTTKEEVQVQFSDDNGATYFTANYRTSIITDGFSQTVDSNTGALLSPVVNNGNCFWGVIKNWNVAAPTLMPAQLNKTAANTYVIVSMHDSAVAMNALKILKPTQDFTAGTLYVWGAREVVDLIEARDPSVSPGAQDIDVAGYSKVNVVAIVTTATNTNRIKVQVSSDGGSTFIAINYYNSWLNGNGTGQNNVENIDSFEIKDGVGGLNHTGIGIFENVDVNMPTRCSAMWNYTAIERIGSGIQVNAEAINFIRVNALSGDMNGGTVWVTGVTGASNC